VGCVINSLFLLGFSGPRIMRNNRRAEERNKNSKILVGIGLRRDRDYSMTRRFFSGSSAITHEATSPACHAVTWHHRRYRLKNDNGSLIQGTESVWTLVITSGPVTNERIELYSTTSQKVRGQWFVDHIHPTRICSCSK
jgi:hypothetical protein